MQTEQGVLRHKEVGIASLVNEDTANAIDQTKSKIHYIINMFADIPLVGPNGLRMKLGKGQSYYGMGKPGKDSQILWQKPGQPGHPVANTPAETLDEYLQRGGDRLQRCVAYPIWNIVYEESIYNMGDFTPEHARTGNDLGAETPMKERGQYAGVCAADFISRYGEEYGARVLVPFIGMDNDEMEIVKEIMRIVQPYAYKLTNLRQENDGELTDEETLLFDLADRGPADERIQGAGLDSRLRKAAQDARRILYGGARQAAHTAREMYADLDENLSNTKLGHKGYKKRASVLDAHACIMLGMPVPAAVATPPQGGAADPNLAEAVKLLTQIAQERGSPVPVVEEFDIEEAKAVIAEMREERLLLEEARKKKSK